MDGIFRDVLENTFRLREDEGEDKVMGLAEAIGSYVRPGMSMGRETHT